MKKIALIFLTITLISCTLDSNSASEDSVNNTNMSQTEVNSNTSLLEAREQHLSNLYDSSLSSIVHIKVIQTVPSMGFFSQNQSRRSNGSGFVWDKLGHIVTNYHVVANVDNVEVQFSDGSEFLAKVVGLDPNSDLAVIKLETNDLSFTPLNLGNSNEVNVGNYTFAIGSPFGQEFSMTSGIVSAIKRTVPSQNSTFTIPNVIQTDAAINPGNSGGPLLSSEGKVIGINTQIKSNSRQNSGVGFAVPVNLAKQVVPSIVNGDKHMYSYLGINALNLDYGSRIRANVQENFKGVLILDVLNEGPAHLAGIKGDSSIQPDLNFDGDIITKINDYKVDTFEDLMSYLALNTTAGDIVKIEVVRDYNYMELDVNLRARPD